MVSDVPGNRTPNATESNLWLDEALTELRYDEYLRVAGVLDVVSVLRAEHGSTPKPPRTDLPLTI